MIQPTSGYKKMKIDEKENRKSPLSVGKTLLYSAQN